MKWFVNRVPTAFVAAVALLLSIAAPSARAEFPERPITLIVPYTAGGSTDILARTVASELGKRLGQPVVIDSRPGAGTVLGATLAQKAAPDGHVLFLGTMATFVVNPIIYAKLPYHPETSFDPIGLIGSASLVLLANAEKVKARSLVELLADIREKPSTYAYGSSGNGSMLHFAGELLWARAGVSGVTHVPYKGSAQIITDLSGGQIPLAFDAIPAGAAAVRGGRVKALAVTGDRRSALLPDVPTIAESGFPGYSLSSWFAIVVPKGVAAETRGRLETELANTIADPQVQQKLTSAGFEVNHGGPNRYFELIRRDTAMLAPIAKSNNIKAE